MVAMPDERAKDWMTGGGLEGPIGVCVTKTTKKFVALKLGEPSSVTTVMKVLVLGPCVSVGVQVMTPLGEMPALVTVHRAFVTVRLYVSVLAGRSTSVAVLVTINSVSSLIV